MRRQFLSPILAAALACLPAAASAQTPASSPPVGALAHALVAACRQNAQDFAPFLTTDNAAAFRDFTPERQAAFLQRLVLLDHPGLPLLSTDVKGKTMVRCDARGDVAELHLGDARIRENLAFVPVEVGPPGGGSRPVRIGLVRENGEWKLLSVGLLLIDMNVLAQQWEQTDMDARESQAITALRDIAEAIEKYRTAWGRMPESLAVLGPAAPGQISPEAANFIDADLAAGRKVGYTFRLRIVPSSKSAEEGKPADAGWELAATPVEYGKTGRRSFFLDSSGVLRGADKQGGIATPTDPRIEPTASRP